MAWNGVRPWGARTGGVSCRPGELRGDDGGCMYADEQFVGTRRGDWDVGFVEQVFVVVKADGSHCCDFAASGPGAGSGTCGISGLVETWILRDACRRNVMSGWANDANPGGPGSPASHVTCVHLCR